MTNFIAVKYTFPSSSGAVLINVNHIKSIDMHNGKIYISVTDQKFQYPVDHTFEEIRQMIDQSGAVIIYPEKSNEVSNQSFNSMLYTEISQAEFTNRTLKCFQHTNIRYFWQLVKYSELELLRIEHFGRKSLNEVKELLAQNNLSLGMDLTGFDPDPVIH